MLVQTSLLLLPIAATWGWFVGKREKKAQITREKKNQLRQDYFKGLNYLINQQPDKAVDVFIKLLEVDSDTVETHLALGNLFRQRGEVDRAIRIHQNLIARPQLTKPHRVQALFALAQDYLRAGVLDRAERLFLELADLGEELQQSLRLLLHIYQQEKDWQKAIDTAKKLEQVRNESMYTTIAQYYCELAEQKWENGRIEEAQEFLWEAAKIDRQCVRASLLLGNIYSELELYSEAIECYKKIKDQDSDYLPESIKPLAHCYHKLGQEQKLLKYLENCLQKCSQISLILEIASFLQKEKGDYAAISFIIDKIRYQPSLRGLSYMLSLYLVNSYGDTREKLSMLQDFILRLLAEKPTYQCVQCGFSGKTLYWLCPSCHQWSTVKPIQSIKGS